MACIRFLISLIAFSVLFAQDPRQVIVVAGRSPLLEIIDPVTLETLSASASASRMEVSDSTA